MGKKKMPSKHRSASHSKRRTRYISAGVVTLVSTLVLGTIVGPLSNTLGARRFRGLFVTAPPPPLPPPTNPSKEYIYAGGRLVATEEPGVTLLAPASLVATTMSNLQPSQVQISWSATAGADHYEVERTTNVNTAYTQVSSNVSGTSFTDTTVSSVTAYLYRVRAVSAGGSVSPFSNIDLATAISFTDDTLQVGTTLVKAEHFTQLRQAVNAARATTSNLAQATWAETITANSTTIKASHVTELRNKLDEARSSLVLTPCSYTAVSIGALIQKAHVDELRVCVK